MKMKRAERSHYALCAQQKCKKSFKKNHHTCFSVGQIPAFISMNIRIKVFSSTSNIALSP
ncbi:MAG: hypothetical protein KJ808_10425 [Acidobacteria bacterium]|nr:hypothetical protein [Acidobacteriota bacterium]MCG2810965.1 hypothetical protein [Candidatus Aminicenantes bacterium]